MLKQDSLGRVRRQVADLSPQKWAEKKFSLKQCGVDAVSGVAFAYDTYTNPSKNNGGLAQLLRQFC